MDYCQMCGSKDRLEPAFDADWQPKTLCNSCRIGAAEIYNDNRHIDILKARIAEARFALARIPHHINCGETACFTGNDTQGPCLRIGQYRRIDLLERKLKQRKAQR